MEGRAGHRRRRRPRRRHRGVAHRHRAGVAGDAGDGPADLGAPRPARRRHRPARPQRHAVGRLSRRAARGQGRAAVPAHQAVMDWVDSHCHIDAATARQTIDEARAAGVTTMIVVGCDRETSIGARQLAAGHEASKQRSGCIPTRPATASTRSSTSIDADTVAIGECGLDYHYDHSPRDVQREAFAAQIALAHERPAPGHPHSGGVGRHVRPSRRRGRPRAGGVPLLHRRRRRGAPGARPRRLPQLLRDRHVQGRR